MLQARFVKQADYRFDFFTICMIVRSFFAIGVTLKRSF